jgi:soluble lytic murein transglycosylase
MVNSRLAVSTEMALAIARRESEFDPKVVSGAGARGLMQVMPGTARQVAGAIGTAYNFSALTSDPDYNIRLGTSYLAGLAREFDGNVILVSAGYNAGPSRPERWMRQRGDPRRRNVDMIDWIEHIPFSETRNYVMRVAESLPIYRARLGREPLPVPFSKELVGKSVRATR